MPGGGTQLGVHVGGAGEHGVNRGHQRVDVHLQVVGHRVSRQLAAGGAVAAIGGLEEPAAGTAAVDSPGSGVSRISGGRGSLLFDNTVGTTTTAAAAAAEGADFVVAGTMYETMSHPGRVPGGWGLLQTLVGLPIPVIGIGGVTAQRAGDVVEAGAHGIAAIRGVLVYRNENFKLEPRDAADLESN